jgi:hypothetical protein
MKELLEFIINSLVSKPDQVQIEETDQAGVVNLSLKVADDDMGMVIGKNGSTIRSIRKLLIARAMAENSKVTLNLRDAQN